jgi:hypothetical protein
MSLPPGNYSLLLKPQDERELPVGLRRDERRWEEALALAERAARITADPGAQCRLVPGQTQAYGQLHGRPPSRFRRADRVHQVAEQALPGLRMDLYIAPPCAPSSSF